LEASEAHISKLIKRCKQGDRQACYLLYDSYSRSMYNIAYRIVGSTEEAQDVVQEAFVSAFKNLVHYRGDSTFGAWLKRIVVNKAINQIKKRRTERLPEDDRWDVKDEEPVDELEKFPFTVEKVKSSIRLLPEGYRLVLTLYLMEGYDHSEIAEILGITESTSKSQFNRSKKKLIELLKSKN
jgi:RNA polymerase sigma factor (sigma-70 family)